MNKNLISHIFLFSAGVIHGASYVVAKEVMPKYIDAYGFILLRVIGATILFWLMGLFFKNEKIEKNDFKKLIICGFFGTAINMLLFFKGLSYTTPINASIIMTCIPVMVLLMASIIIKEKITFKKSFGIFLGIVGAVLLIASGKEIAIGTNTLLGDTLVFINALSYGLYLVLVKPLMNKYSAFTVIKWVFLFGTMFVIPFGFQEVAVIEWGVLPTNIVWAIIYIVIGTTFVSYLFNSYALKHIGPSVVAMYIYLQPIIAAIISLYLAVDSLTSIKIISTLMVFIGVYLVSSNKKKVLLS